MESDKHPSEVVNVGDTVNVYIKSFDREERKISLGFKRSEDNPWEILKKDYPVGTVTDVQIVGMTTFGAFARMIPGIDSLIRIFPKLQTTELKSLRMFSRSTML